MVDVCSACIHFEGWIRCYLYICNPNTPVVFSILCQVMTIGALQFCGVDIFFVLFYFFFFCNYTSIYRLEILWKSRWRAPTCWKLTNCVAGFYPERYLVNAVVANWCSGGDEVIPTRNLKQFNKDLVHWNNTKFLIRALNPNNDQGFQEVRYLGLVGEATARSPFQYKYGWEQEQWP